MPVHQIYLGMIAFMPTYKDVDKASGILSYEYGADWITVEFKSGAYRHYRYTSASAGSLHISQMKKLADHGENLNSYINRYVCNLYDKKW